MRAKRLLVAPELIAGDVARLDGKLFHYVHRVMRLDVGARLELADGKGGLCLGVIANVGDGELLVTIEQRQTIDEPRGSRITLIFGLAKGSRTEWVLQKATELGAFRLIPAICERSIARPKQNAQKHERWSEIVRQAGRQSGRSHLPRLEPVCSFAHALGLAADAELRLIGSTQSPRPLADFHETLAGTPPVALAVGPEGGLTDAEIDLATKAGFEEVSLGPLVLRTETAALALLAIVGHLSGG